MIKAISFDIGNTIYLASQNQTVLNELGQILNLPLEQVKRTFRQIFNKNNGDLRELTEKFCKELKSNKFNEILFFFENLSKKSEKNQYVDKNIIKLIKKLKKLGIKVVLSSSSNILKNYQLDEGLLKYVDHVFRTYEVGYLKDEENYYRFIEKKLNLKSEEILNVGNSLKYDYEMPKKFGWNAILFNCPEKGCKTVEELSKEIEKFLLI